MPALTDEQILQVYFEATQTEGARRVANGALHTAEMEDEIHFAGLRAVAAAQLMVAAPATNTHPLFLRLARQARQLDHARNTMTEQNLERVGPLVEAMYTTTVMIAQLGVKPAEQWESFAESLIETNVELVAKLVSAGLAKLPPAEHDHD